jgi:hypothetical protein
MITENIKRHKRKHYEFYRDCKDGVKRKFVKVIIGLFKESAEIYLK